MMNEHPFHKQKLEVSNTLHDKLIQAPMHAKKLKRRNTIFAVATIVCVVVNLSYLSVRQEKLTEEELLETQYANFGFNLSI